MTKERFECDHVAIGAKSRHHSQTNPCNQRGMAKVFAGMHIRQMGLDDRQVDRGDRVS